MTLSRSPKPSIPSILLWDNGGNQAFTSTGEFHTWDTEQIKTSHFYYKLDGTKIILNNNQQNMYEVTFECSFYTYLAATIALNSDIYKNGVIVDGSQAKITLTGSGQAAVVRNCLSIHFLLYLKGGDYIQIKSITNNVNAVLSTADTSRLMINFMPIRGWDNSKAGRIEYKGMVMR